MHNIKMLIIIKTIITIVSFLLDLVMILGQVYQISLWHARVKQKSKVLLNKRITKVQQLALGVQVITQDSSKYSGNILVGADGIHSTVRREMWRIADELQPGSFPRSDRTGASIQSIQ